MNKKRILIQFYVSILSLMIISCNQIGEITTIPEAKSNFDLFAQYGEVHNAMLSYIDSNIDITTTCSTKEDALDYLVELQSRYAEELTLSDSDKKFIKELLPTYKHLYNKDNICLSKSTRSSSCNVEADTIYVYTTEDIYNSIEASFSRGEIDNFERQSLINLITWCEENVTGNMTNETFEGKFNTLITQWENHYSDTDFSSLIDEKGEFKNELKQVPAGAVSGVVLNISQSSLEYWDMPETKSVVATIVAQDIVGAVIGGVSGGVGSAIIGGEWNWGSVAWGAGVGAITGSTGVVGKVSKWIVRFIK